MRDGDFQRGLNCALRNKWIKLHHRDRYCYILTDEGFAYGRQVKAAIPKCPSAQSLAILKSSFLSLVPFISSFIQPTIAPRPLHVSFGFFLLRNCGATFLPLSA